MTRLTTDSEASLIELREDDSIAVITLSNPARLNAFSKAMRVQLYPVLLTLESRADIRAIVLDARFAAPFIRMGMIPDTGGVWSLLQRLGQRRTFELCALAEPIDAEKAQRIDLINDICKPGAALEQALSVARRIARQPALALALLKSALAVGADTLDQSVNTEIASQGC